MDESENPDGKKNSTGPGSYDVSNCFGFNSEYSAPKTSRFGSAPRQSMAMKTPSPGAVYQIEKCYWNGPDKTSGIGFNCDSRKPLYNEAASANADMVYPQMKTGPAITMAARFKVKNPSESTPGAVYEVHVSRPSLQASQSHFTVTLVVVILYIKRCHVTLDLHVI